MQHVWEDVYIGQITDMRRRATEQGRLWRRLGRARYEGNVANKYYKPIGGRFIHMRLL